MKIRIALSLLLACGLTAVGLHAQSQPYRFEQLRPPGGSDQSYVTSITQDQYGYMWFGTWGGLLKYDGYAFTTYASDPTDTTSLLSDWVETLYVDREGTLWVGTYGGGLSRFDPDTETFTHYRHDPDDPTSLSQDSVTVILEDDIGAFWVGTMGGLNRLDRETGTFTRYRYDPDDTTSLSNDQVRALYEDSRGGLWIGTNSPYGTTERDNPGPGGLNRFDRETGFFTRYLHDPDDPKSLLSNHVMSLFEDSRGTFWVGTEGEGLHSMDREAGTFTRHRYVPGYPHRSNTSSSSQQVPIGVSIIFEDDAGALWIGAHGGGLNRYDLETGELDQFEHDPNDPASLSANGVWTMHQSRDGARWIGMIPGGIDKVHPTQGPFAHFAFTGGAMANALHVDTSGIIYAGACCPSGLISFGPTGDGALSYRPLSTRVYSEGTIATIEQSRDGTLWVGTYAGTEAIQQGSLYRLDPRTSLRALVLSDSTRSTERVGPIVAIHEDHEGGLWLGTRWSGLFRMNLETGALTHYAHDPGDSTNLSHTNVTTLYEAPSEPGVLWVGTEGGGLSRLDPETGTFTRYQHDPSDPTSLSGGYVTSIYEDAHERLWVGTRSGGLNRLDRRSGTFRRFDAYNSGLHDNHVACMLGDGDGNLWMGTPRGLTRFDSEADLFYTFGPEHGVKATPFTAAACDRGRAGALIFGGGNGFVAFHPDEVRTDRSAPPVVLTGFLLARQPVGPDPEGPLRAPLHEAEEIRLAHDEHTFTFEFAGLDYRDPAANQYAYLLEGYDETWREAGTQRRASYYRVPPGEYLFRVRAANSDGIWNEEGTSVRVRILPPWWRTWWAYALYALAFATGVFVVDRVQRRRLIRKERERAEREAEKLRAEAAEVWANYLQAENQRQTQELEHARALQLSMLPDEVPEHPTVEIAAHMQTATEVGGDYYDFDLSEDGTLTFAIGDATGHGVEAGTMVTAMKSLFNVFSSEDDLERVMKASSQALRRMHLPRLYMALALGKLHESRLELVGAGMPPAFICRANSGCIEEVPLKGMPLGSGFDFPYETHRITLSAGDSLVLMSDGFPELRSEKGEMLGYERMAEVIAEAADRPPEEIIAHLRETAKAWCNGQAQDDDMTFVVMRVKA